jgi:hypothetical protein
MSETVEPVRPGATPSALPPVRHSSPECQLGLWGCMYGIPFDASDEAGPEPVRADPPCSEPGIPWQIDAAILAGAGIAAAVLALVGCPLF